MTRDDILYKSFNEKCPQLRVISHDLNEAINAAMDSYYNQAIDDAISSVRLFYTEASSVCPETLQPYLESLKKKP